MEVEKLFRPRFAVPVITLITLLYRLVPLRFEYMLGFDPYFHLAYIEEALKAGEWFNFLTIAGGPWGFQVRTFHPLGLWATPAYVYKLLSPFGVSLQTAFRITPVIFGTLTVLAFYFALLRLYDERRAFFASLFLAMSYGHVFRSMANYYRGDNYMLFWYSLAFLGIALALTYKKTPHRFVFYLIPALASGLASVFWQAYYPIFVFLLANGVFLGVGAFLLGKDRYIPDGITLTVSTALGALLANVLGEKFGYGMLEYNQLGRKVAEKLGLSFGILKDAYLLVHLKYLVPLALLALLAIFVLSKTVRDRRGRALIVAVLGIVAVYILLARFEALRDLSTGFGIFREVPIAETRPSSFSDLWNAFALGLFITPLFLLRFRPKEVKVQDFMLLGLVLPSLYMIKTWTRFLFIGSMGIALMAGMGLWELYTILTRLDGKKGLAITMTLIVVVPVLNATFGLERVAREKPFMNEHWENALRWLGKNSNENDIVLAWWDYGHWVTYYSRRSPVAQGGPNAGVAAYLLGLLDENWAQNIGVDYVIVAYEDFLKLGAIVDTARLSKRWENLTGSEYGFALLPLTGVYGNILTFENGQYKAFVARRDTLWDAKVMAGNAVGYPSELLVEAGNETINAPLFSRASLGPVLYANLNYGYAFLMSPTMANTTMARLFAGDAPNHHRLVYSDGGRIKVYRFEHPNVIITRTNGTVVFHFENATGTGLGIYGFLDNGTKVFEKWYTVKGLAEFELPGEVNGTVIRYTYAEGKQIVDRGVFRRE